MWEFRLWGLGVCQVQWWLKGGMYTTYTDSVYVDSLPCGLDGYDRRGCIHEDATMLCF